MSVKILLVEDSPTMRQLIGFALRSISGMNLVEAADGLEGLKQCQSDSFDLALVDINMPLMDGLKLISKIRQDTENKNIPIVIITTEGKEKNRERAEELGVSTFLTKPVNSADILKAVRELLDL